MSAYEEGVPLAEERQHRVLDLRRFQMHNTGWRTCRRFVLNNLHCVTWEAEEIRTQGLRIRDAIEFCIEELPPGCTVDHLGTPRLQRLPKALRELRVLERFGLRLQHPPGALGENS